MASPKTQPQANADTPTLDHKPMAQNHHDELKSSSDGAQIATAQEKSMSLFEAVKLYPKAIGWSMVLSTALVMEGYDLLLLSNLYASPQFNKKYGTLTRRELTLSLQLNALWRSLPHQSARKYNCEEVAPVVLRPYLTTYVNLCWVMGQFIASGVLRASLVRDDDWAYKIPYAVQWVWPIPLLVGCYLAPESPWWEVRRGNPEGARRSLERLTTESNPDYNVDETLAMIEHTNHLEKSISEGVSYWDCFKGIDRRRTEIVCCVWLTQTLCGTNIMDSTYFMKQAGLPTVEAFNMSLGQYALGFVGTILSWFLMACAGRRTIYFSGVCTLFVILMVVGFISLAGKSNTSATWAIGVMLMIFTFVYDLSVGPVCYSLVSELSSTRLKTKSIVLARIGYNLSNTVNVLTNYQLNPTAWNWGAKSAFFWVGTCFVCLVWVFFRLT